MPSLGSKLRGGIKNAARRAGHDAFVDAFEAARRPYWRRRDELDIALISLVIATTLGDDSNAIDIGASSGTFVRRIVHRAPRGHHIAFEPNPTAAANLRERFPTVELHEVALANERGLASFVHVLDSEALSALVGRSSAGLDHPTETITVEVDRLDDVLPRGYVPQLVKIDVEGAEAEVIAGAVETLGRHQPLVVFEHGGMGAGTQRPADLYDTLTDLRYGIFDIDGNGPYTLTAMDETFDEGKIWNWVAIPRQ